MPSAKHHRARRASSGVGAPVAHNPRVRLPVAPPLEPMLAKPVAALPDGPGWAYEPKWDGFRALVFRDGDELLVQSRDLTPARPLLPGARGAAPGRPPGREPSSTARSSSPAPRGLDFDALLLRIHPAESRVRRLAAETPASFVAWDLLALDDDDLRERAVRRAAPAARREPGAGRRRAST